MKGFRLLVNVTASSTRAVRPQQRLSHLHTLPFKHKPLRVPSTKKNTQHGEKAKWLGVRASRAQTLGLKRLVNRRHQVVFRDLAAGDDISPQPLEAQGHPQAWRELQLLRQRGDRQGRGCGTQRL